MKILNLKKLRRKMDDIGEKCFCPSWLNTWCTLREKDGRLFLRLLSLDVVDLIARILVYICVAQSEDTTVWETLYAPLPPGNSCKFNNSFSRGRKCISHGAMAKDSNDRPPIFQSFDWEVKTKIKNTWLTNLSDSYRNNQKDLEFVISFYFEAFRTWFSRW